MLFQDDLNGCRYPLRLVKPQELDWHGVIRVVA